jgi:hypothetical protein
MIGLASHAQAARAVILIAGSLRTNELEQNWAALAAAFHDSFVPRVNAMLARLSTGTLGTGISLHNLCYLFSAVVANGATAGVARTR